MRASPFFQPLPELIILLLLIEELLPDLPLLEHEVVDMRFILVDLLRILLAKGLQAGGFVFLLLCIHGYLLLVELFLNMKFNK